MEPVPPCSVQRLVVILTVFFFSLGLLAVLPGLSGGARTGTFVSFLLGLDEGNTSTLHIPHRKLLSHGSDEKVEPNRIWGDKCSKSDIVINQGPTAPLPSGIPTYTVEIMNMCVSGCDISAIHLRCGWFSSARLINPKLLKRLRYNDCLVNDGLPCTVMECGDIMDCKKDDFVIGKKLGEGSFGKVYKVTLANKPSSKEGDLVLKKATEYGAVEIWMNERVRRACANSCADFVYGFLEAPQWK